MPASSGTNVQRSETFASTISLKTVNCQAFRVQGGLIFMMPPRTGQAPVVLCPDVLVEIFNHLHPGRRTQKEKNFTRKHRRVCRQALLSAALTCRALSNLALDVLWRALDDILPLLHLLPGHRGTFVLKPQVKPETWAKFQSYATRVREIGLYPDLERVHPSVWTFLAIKCRGSPLMPRLHYLDACDICLDDLSPLFLLLSPSLRSLSLAFDEESERDITAPRVTVLILQHIAQVAPRIKALHMSGRHHFTSMEHLTMLKNFVELAELSIDTDIGVTAALFSQLPTTTSLNALTVAICSSNTSYQQSLKESLRSLRSVTLRGCLDDLVNLILACRQPLLNALTLQVNDCSNPRMLTPGLTSICQHPDLAKSLTRIGLEFRPDIGMQRPQTLTQCLEPLFSLSKVMHCELIFHKAPPSVSNRDLTRFGEAWPNLQRLNVRSHMMGYDWDDNDRGGYSGAWNNKRPDILHPTIHGLTELARRCRGLRYLHLVTLDACARTLPRSAPGHLAHPHLRELLVDHVPNDTSAWRCVLAEALDVAFPRLDISLSKAECAYPDVRPGWRRIMLLVRAERYRRNPSLARGPGAYPRAVAAAKFAASRKSLAALDRALSDAEDGDSDREWDFDSDSDSNEGSDASGSDG